MEQEGVLRSKKSIAAADLALLVLDSNQEFTPEDLSIVEEMRSRPAIAILNKCDLPPLLSQRKVQEATGIPVVIGTSALLGTGLGSLKEAIVRLLSHSHGDYEEVLVTNTRHVQALTQAKEAFARAEVALSQGLSEEFLAVELREALNSLGEVTGKITTEELLTRIFSTFCIGK